FERDRDLAAVGGIPGPQFDAHRRWSPIRNRGRWPAALPRWPAVASRNRLAGDEPNGRAGMGWQPELDELRERERQVRELGEPEQMAHELRLPIIRISEGSGGGGSVKTIETAGRANLPGRVGSNLPYYYTTANLGRVPVVALGLGSVAGLGAARMAASHYSVMTKETSALFVAGPPVVNALNRVPGADLDRFELGGWEIQTRCGAVEHAVDTEEA